MNKLRQSFGDEGLFEEALTHSSWVNENPGKRKSNERLEFLGDAVLELVVTQALFLKFPLKEEGYLTALRANLVNTKNLSDVARKLEIGPQIHLSKGESPDKNSLLADTLEAIIGAIYLDQGIVIASKFIHKNILSDLPEHLKRPIKSAKSVLQERAQALGFLAPKYKVVRSFGPDHAKEFEVEVIVNSEVLGTGIGKGKNEAQQKAASVGLEKLASKRYNTK